MNLSLSGLLELVRYSLQSPREGAQLVMRAGVPLQARWLILLLMAVGSALLAHLSIALMPPMPSDEMGLMFGTPFSAAVLQLGVMLAAVQASYWVGRWRGGVGSFADALLLMGWLQFIMLLLQAAQLVAQLILPVLAAIIGYVSIIIFLWLFSCFIAELHKFQSVPLVFLGILATMMAFGLLVAVFILPSIGV